ncbi:MAG: hypothetical protein WED05_12350 [Candidatus Atabeyarchaeum deiterrae]
MVVWLKDNLGTASYAEKLDENGVQVIEVRDLVEGKGNDRRILKERMLQCIREIKAGRKVVIRCDKGIVRSNTLAIGVLTYLGLTLEEAIKLVSRKMGAQAINLELLNDIMEVTRTL